MYTLRMYYMYVIYTVHSGSPTSRQISQWLQCSPPWLLMSGLSSHFFYYSVFSLLLSEASVTEILSKWLQDFNSLGNHWYIHVHVYIEMISYFCNAVYENNAGVVDSHTNMYMSVQISAGSSCCSHCSSLESTREWKSQPPTTLWPRSTSTATTTQRGTSEKTSSTTAASLASTARRETLTWPVSLMRGDSVMRSLSRCVCVSVSVCICIYLHVHVQYMYDDTHIMYMHVHVIPTIFIHVCTCPH